MGYKTVTLAEETWEEILDILYNGSIETDRLYVAVQYQVQPGILSNHEIGFE